jgi:hypothetical protein
MFNHIMNRFHNSIFCIESSLKVFEIENYWDFFDGGNYLMKMEKKSPKRGLIKNCLQ